MKKIMHILFLSCFKATELIERRLHFTLSFKEKLQLKLHLMMCDACSKYEKQSLIIEKGIEQMHMNGPITMDLEKLKSQINNKLKDTD